MKKIKKTNTPSIWDDVVVGAGFYGIMIALKLKKIGRKTILLESKNDILTAASYNNQARIHNGYHYPRSYTTALRSHLNYRKFQNDFKDAVIKNKMFYAIARNSKVNATQFKKLCEHINAPLNDASADVYQFFNPNLVNNVFEVDEKVFDAGKLRKLLQHRLMANNLNLKLNTKVTKITKKQNHIQVETHSGPVMSKNVYVCTYAHINNLLNNSALKPLGFKYELVDIPLFSTPDFLKSTGITIIDGPFFGALPFPDCNAHTLYHVRYSILNNSFQNKFDLSKNLKSNFLHMKKDATRYIPSLDKINYQKSLYEVRTVLEKDEFTDARPILYRKDYGFKGNHVVMGGKIDNIYDILENIGN